MAAESASETASTERAPALRAKPLILCARFLLPKRKRFAGLRFGDRPRRNEPTFFVNLLFPVRFSGTSVSEFFSQDSAIPNQNPALSLDRNAQGVVRYEKQRFCLE